MSTTAPPPEPTMPASLPRRRGWRVWLRALPFVALAALVLLAGQLWRRAQPHLRATSALGTQGVRADWHGDEDLLRGGYTTVAFEPTSFFNSQRNPDWTHLAGLHRVRRFDAWTASGFTDALVLALSRLPDLEEIRIAHYPWSEPDTALTDAGLAPVRGLRKMRVLQLPNTSISDAGLANLAGLGRLEELNLRGTRITDAGLAHLAGLANLEDLDLQDTAITDAGLVHLAKLKNLRTVQLNGTAVTQAGATDLEAQLPEANLIYDESPRIRRR